MFSVDHITIAVSDLEKSKRFYDALATRLGLKTGHEDEGAKEWSDGHFSVWIITAKTKDPIRTNEGIGINHLAFRANVKNEVDTFYDWLVEMNIRIDARPTEYPQYGDDYYAVFFFDPDGTRLELMYSK